jgi:predicted RNA-binding protein YlxR (DUF448 family)
VETKKKKIPERRCVGCGETKEKKSLIRVLRTPEGEVVLDVTGKKSGRGAYICHSLSCFKKARKSKRFETNLSIEIPEDIYEKLEKELTESAI